jgi:hypothetical protein
VEFDSCCPVGVDDDTFTAASSMASLPSGVSRRHGVVLVSQDVCFMCLQLCCVAFV